VSGPRIDYDQHLLQRRTIITFTGHVHSRRSKFRARGAQNSEERIRRAFIGQRAKVASEGQMKVNADQKSHLIAATSSLRNCAYFYLNKISSAFVPPVDRATPPTTNHRNTHRNTHRNPPIISTRWIPRKAWRRLQTRLLRRTAQHMDHLWLTRLCSSCPESSAIISTNTPSAGPDTTKSPSTEESQNQRSSVHAKSSERKRFHFFMVRIGSPSSSTPTILPP